MLSSAFFSSMSFFGIPRDCPWASINISHSSLVKCPACSSPKKPARSNWALLGSTLAYFTFSPDIDPESSFNLGKNKLMAILATISSSKPNIVSIFFSIHWDMTAVFTLVKSTAVAKDGGNLVERSSLFWAAFDAMDAVPFMDGILRWKMDELNESMEDRFDLRWIHK